MAFINTPFDVTMTSPKSGLSPELLSAMANTSGKTFEQAVAQNRIYRGKD
jgi:hypothetical protein